MSHGNGIQNCSQGFARGRSRVFPRRLRLTGFPAPFCPGSSSPQLYPIFCVQREGSGLFLVGLFQNGSGFPFTPGQRLAKGGGVTDSSESSVGGFRCRVASGVAQPWEHRKRGRPWERLSGGRAWLGGVEEGGEVGGARVVYYAAFCAPSLGLAKSYCNPSIRNSSVSL